MKNETTLAEQPSTRTSPGPRLPIRNVVSHNNPPSTGRDLLLAIQSTLDNVLSHADCASFFGKDSTFNRLFGSPTAAKVLDALFLGGSKYGSIVFTDDPLPMGAAADTFQDHPLRAFFNFPTSSTVKISTLDLDGYFNTSAHNAELIVLHELGHVLYNLAWSGTIKPDSTSVDASTTNTDNFEKACGKYLQ